MSALRVALAQMNGGGDVAANIAQAEALIAEAAGRGAQFVMTPEVTNMIAPNSDALKAAIQPEATDPTLAALRAAAKAHGLWLTIGSVALKGEDGRAVNRQFLIDPAGEIKARYDKIHMFRANLPGGETYDEARNFAPGETAVVAETPWGGLGITICYDMRFPHLYRALAKAGADMLAVPAAFTVPTGRAHWHVLLRARAIESGCFVMAAAQWGRHGGADAGTLRESYGHSLIVAPWGEVLADAGDGVGLAVADLDLAQVAAARGRIPSLSGDRPFAF